MVPVGVLPDGQMEVPRDTDAVGWYRPGANPGDRGNAVMAGHVDSKTGPAVFYKLNKLKKGDIILIRLNGGFTRAFSVKKAVIYRRDRAPMEQIFGPTGDVNLNLITCTGTFDKTKGTHQERLVIYAGLKAAHEIKNRVPPL
ncbi:hypothetical protein DCCM_4334 [Desulfocucumis palustris]|uniref:Class F sortase n=1 Tax=Desulfocucumis palustris TaxID=1898651 RepID=A0A2L2XMN3_9FIRM|nr:hypothetical protein DCCM_4334 [Desulfocucumis palustris]